MQDQAHAREQRTKRSLWRRACRFSLVRGRVSRRLLDGFVAAFATSERVLVVHCVDIDHRRHFPNAFVVGSRKGETADIAADPHYLALSQVPDGSYPLIICTGLLEHVPDPQRLIDAFHRILQPGGRLVLSASAVFSFHGAPENYFHFTPGGYRHLFRNWTQVQQITGSSGPYTTLAVLVQRINLQCDVFPPIRLLNDLLYWALPLLDRAVLRQYDNLGQRDKGDPVDSIMPATLQAVVVR
jgi:SAM-dependent methyltransferase